MDLLLLVDTSGSMGQEVAGRPKWGMVNEALMAFLGDPMSAGLGVGLAMFPPVEAAKVCTSDTQCGGIGGRARCAPPGPAWPRADRRAVAALHRRLLLARLQLRGGRPLRADGRRVRRWRPRLPRRPRRRLRHQRADLPAARGRHLQRPALRPPLVPIAALPAAEPPLRDALGSVVPGGLTPMQPAVEGSLAHLQALMPASRGRRAALVLATDGLPEGCDGQSIGAIAANVAAARAAGVPTYVIGVFAPETLAESQPALAELATAGGTGTPFILDPNQSLTQRFLDALNQIRGNVLACDFQIPNRRPARRTSAR